MEHEDDLKQKLQDLQKRLGKKQTFEEAVSSIRSLLRVCYPYASSSLQKLFYSVVCRVATILKTRYTAPGFWKAGLGLFLEAEELVTESFEREHLQSCIAHAQEQLHEIENQFEGLGGAQNRTTGGFLFEGHLTVDPEPPQPEWPVQSSLLTAVANLFGAESSQDPMENSAILGNVASLLQELTRENDPVTQRPASEEVVAKLPIITLTEELLAKLGSDAECAICKENLILNDKMQVLPCKHTFHPPCVKSWLDEHNSCPICRHELRTDDHAYESWKEREKEAEEERKGAANAIRGGEYMYV